MNVDQVYDIFRDGEGDPREALQWALDHWEEASDRLLSKLRALCAKLPADGNSPDYDEADGEALFTLAHLFAEKRDTRAYAPLCDRMARDEELSAWLGDAPQTTLPGVFINLYDGDLAPIQKLILRADGDEDVRAAALEAFTYLVRIEKAASEDEARTFLMDFLRDAAPREPDHIWAEWALAVARLGFADLGPEVARLFSKSWIADFEMTLQYFHRVLAEARADATAAFAASGIGPFGSTVELFAKFQLDGFDDEVEDFYEESIDETPGETYVNPMRDVGRNDPCPCGSGKKYKKCCLAA